MRSIDRIWDYYLVLERDLENTSRYVEPVGQETVYSYEFMKLIILACTEIEAILKLLCKESSSGSSTAGNMCAYKQEILSRFPKIVEAEVFIPRLDKFVKPFEGWDTGKLFWWGTYQDVKHNQVENLSMATYRVAVTAISALYILIFYFAAVTKVEFHETEAKYIYSEYSRNYLADDAPCRLPDFEVTTK